jgi:hypothetical protein
VSGSDTIFTGDGAPTFYGDPFTDLEIDEAFVYLRERNLVAGTAAWGGTLVRPRLTSDGVECAEDEEGDVRRFLTRSVPESTVSPGQTHYYYFGSVGQAAFGQNIQQTLNQGMTPEQLRETFAAMRDVLAELPPSEEREDLTIVLQDLESEATSPEPNAKAVERRVGMARRLTEKVIESGAASVGTGGGQRLLELLAQLAHHFN